ncbi:hotdog domain-containing protein [Geothrix fermentans]|jgi:acyl-CoA hydrolase|uniref:acyl-CoA thioesterase n=1 Tax=Geothrix fermentans TaxID=44676 RepID=UPI00040AB8B6|nr:acyl-CoA thioesterase [Geothrix fermentans]
MTGPEDLIVTVPLSSDPALRRRYMLLDEDLPANVRFGLILEVLDKVAEECALAYVRRAHPQARVVTAAIDNIYVRNAADVHRDLVFRARVNFVGRTSLEVGIRIEHPEGEGVPATHIASCYFTMVARSTTGAGAESLTLPGFEPGDDLSVRRWERAIARREGYRHQLHQAQEPPTREEYALLASLHAAQESRDFRGLAAADCITSGWQQTYPEHENVPTKVFGGHLIREAFGQSAICAEQMAPHRPVIVAVNRINFVQPVRMGDTLQFLSRAVYAGDTSICVETDIIRMSRDRTQTHLSNSCVFTFVNVDDQLRPQPVPPIYPATYAEDARYLAAHRRREARLAWKASRGR